MKLSTALKISGLCLLALGAELVMAYFIFSNYAFSLAETGQYGSPEAYTTGPLGALAKVFYGVFAVTLVIGVGAPLLACLSLAIRHYSKAP